MSNNNLILTEDVFLEFLNRLNSPIPVREFRDNFKDMLDKTKDSNIVLTKHGKPSAVLLDYELFENIQKMFNFIIKQQLKKKSLASMKKSIEEVSNISFEQSEKDIFKIIDDVVEKDRKSRGIK